MTQGDVLAVLAFILATLVTLWASILAAGLIFSEKTRHAAQLAEAAPGKTILAGAGLSAVGVGIGLVLINSKAGLLMLFGWILLSMTLCIAMIGSAGLARVVSGRMQSLAPTQSALAMLARGGALLIGAGLLPGVGWVLLFPLQLFASLGAGFQAVTSRERLPYEQPATQTQQQ